MSEFSKNRPKLIGAFAASAMLGAAALDALLMVSAAAYTAGGPGLLKAMGFDALCVAAGGFITAGCLVVANRMQPVGDRESGPRPR